MRFGLLLINIIWFTKGQQLSDYKQLFTNVISNHQKYVVPRHNASTPVELSTVFSIMTLGGFEELSETIVILGGLVYTWKDPDLTWNPATYGGIAYTSISNQFVWNPPVILLNSVDNLAPLSSGTDISVIVTYDGNITLPIADVMKARCSADIYKFPFDSQKCTLQFNIWGFLETDVKFTLPDNSIVENFYSPNSNWDLISVSSSVRSWFGYSTYEVHVTIKRQPLYYSTIVIAPTIAFAFLNPLVFLLPVESGERIGLAMTILLSYAVFLTIVSASIPASSNPMSFLLVMMIIIIIVSGVIVIEVIVISYLYYRDDDENINKVWKWFGGWNKKFKVAPAMCKPLEKKGSTTPVIPLNDNSNISWKDVCNGLDLFCLVSGYIVVVLLMIILLSVTMT